MKRLYTVISDIIPKQSLTNKCIVLDLDETLVHSYDKDNALELLTSLDIMFNSNDIELRNRIYYFTITRPGFANKFIWGVLRPHVAEFLIFCLSYFNIVAVWSAGTRDYVNHIVKIIFSNLKQPPIVFSANETDFSDGRVLKDLRVMFDFNEFTRENMNIMNTLTIDDNRDAIRNNTSNAILIPAYKPAFNISSMSIKDDTLLKIKAWLSLNEVIVNDDVRELNKNIFNTTLEEYNVILNKESVPINPEPVDESLSILNQINIPRVKVE